MEAVFFVGIQGAGKSSFYKERFYDSHVRINRDMLKTAHRERVLIHACLDLQQRFVVDNTSPTKAERAEYIALAHAARFRVIGYFFQVSTREAIARNEARHGQARIPLPGLLGTYKRLEPPSRSEGFDELFVVRIAEDRTFFVSSAPETPLTKAPDQ